MDSYCFAVEIYFNTHIFANQIDDLKNQSKRTDQKEQTMNWPNPCVLLLSSFVDSLAMWSVPEMVQSHQHISDMLVYA